MNMFAHLLDISGTSFEGPVGACIHDVRTASKPVTSEQWKQVRIFGARAKRAPKILSAGVSFVLFLVSRHDLFRAPL